MMATNKMVKEISKKEKVLKNFLINTKVYSSRELYFGYVSNGNGYATVWL